MQELESKLLCELQKSSLTVASHDAGGANVLEAFMRMNKLIAKQYHLSGPAMKIFGFTQESSRYQRDNTTEILLASTGWQTNAEKLKIKSALVQQMRTIVFLDHWTNFRERLTYDEISLPILEIVTFDKEAQVLASNFFPNAIIYLFPNYYLIEQSIKIQKLRTSSKKFDIDYLYIGEPIRGKPYTEEEAFSNFLKKIIAINSIGKKIAIRRHPSQVSEIDLESFVKRFNIPLVVTQDSTLAEDLARSKAIVGCNSMAITLAHMCLIPTFCAVPKPFQSELPANYFCEWS